MVSVTASQAMASNASELLAQDLSIAVKTLPRETRLYHYFGINLNGYQIEDTLLNQPQERYSLVSARLRTFANTFWDLNNHTTKFANAGLGLYLAVDPYASSPEAASDTGANFGSTMMEVTFSAGTKYLALINAIQLRDETLQAIVEETGMKSSDYKKLFEGKRKGFYRDTLQYMAEPQNTAFRKIVLNVFAQQGITMTEYGWQAATSALCNVATGSGKIHHSAFVYVGGPLTKSVVKSVTMVYWNGGNIALDTIENESLERNKKLHNLLQVLRPMEKEYQSAAEAKDKVLMKSIYSDIKSTIANHYNDDDEIQDLRLKTFGCVK